MEEVISSAVSGTAVCEQKLDFERVLALSLNVGKGLLSCGASVSRVENAVERICSAYGVAEVNAWVVPSMIIASIVTPLGDTFTQMERVYIISNHLQKMERYNQLSRDICTQKIPLAIAEKSVKQVREERYYKTWQLVLSGACAAGAFSVLFGGSVVDAFLTMIIGAVMSYFNIILSVKSFNSYARSFMLSVMGGCLCILLSSAFDGMGIECHCSMIIIGTIMVVAPGLLVCNAVRDLFVGDLFSGTFQILNGILTMLAIVAGYATAMIIFKNIAVFNDPFERTGAAYYIYSLVAGVFGVAGFSLMFSISLKRLPWATANAIVTYAIYLVMMCFDGDVFVANFVATVYGAIASEILARVTKAPSTVYIIPAIIVLVPGGPLYYTLNYLVEGDWAACTAAGIDTALIFLGIAVGLSIVAALFQIIHPIKHKKRFTERLSSFTIKKQ